MQIAWILAGGLGAANAAPGIAALLLAVAPVFPTPGDRDLAVDRIARAIVQDVPPHPDTAPGPARRAIYRENLIRRGQYGIQALKRVARHAKAKDPERNIAERVIRGVQLEGRWFDLHRQASGQRVQGATLIDAAVDRWGELLGWRSNIRPTSRPHHARAHMANFKAGTPPRETEGYPATLVHCDCVPAPPVPGARTLR